MYWRRTVSGALLALALVAQAPAIDVPLKLKLHSEGVEDYQPYGYQSLRPLDRLPEGRWQLPELISEEPLYFQVTLGDEKRLMIVDKAKPEDEGPGRLYFDANGNGILMDDPVYAIKISERMENTGHYGPIEVERKIDGATMAYYFIVRQHSAPIVGGADQEVVVRRSFLMQTCCHLEGELELGGKRYRFMLSDKDGNGRFDDQVTWRKGRGVAARAYPEGDHFFVTTDRKFLYQDYNILAPHLFIGGKLFDVKVDLGRSTLVLTPTRAATVPVKLGMAVEHMTLCNEEGTSGVMLFQPGRTATVPVGSYRLTHYNVLRRDPQGDLWSLTASGTVNMPFADLNVAGKTLPLGEPYVAKAEVPLYARTRAEKAGSGPVGIQFTMSGAGGEKVSDLTHLSGENTETPLVKKGTRARAPSYRILEPDGKVVAKGSFEYG